MKPRSLQPRDVSWIDFWESREVGTLAGFSRPEPERALSLAFERMFNPPPGVVYETDVEESDAHALCDTNSISFPSATTIGSGMWRVDPESDTSRLPVARHPHGQAVGRPFICNHPRPQVVMYRVPSWESDAWLGASCHRVGKEQPCLQEPDAYDRYFGSAEDHSAAGGEELPATSSFAGASKRLARMPFSPYTPGP